MSKISPIGQPKFTNMLGPSMYNYKCFKIKSKIKGDPSPKEIFSMWLLQVKSACHKWRVPQNIRWAFPWHATSNWDSTIPNSGTPTAKQQNRSTYHTTQLSSKYLRNYLDNLGQSPLFHLLQKRFKSICCYLLQMVKKSSSMKQNCRCSHSQQKST